MIRVGNGSLRAVRPCVSDFSRNAHIGGHVLHVMPGARYTYTSVQLVGDQSLRQKALNCTLGDS